MKDVTRETSYSGVLVLIPAYEPDEHLPQTVTALMAGGLGPVVVVDDGSSAAYAAIFARLEALGVCVCRHAKNMGKGAAIKTGIGYIMARFPRCAGVVTADADGQHAPSDIARVAERTAQTSGLVLGVRNFDRASVPSSSYFGNRITSVIFRLITGTRCSDTQTGLRGIPAALFPLALAAEGNRYEYEMNFLLDVAEQKLSIDMLPIKTIYLDGNRSSHFRKVRDSLLIYRRPVAFLGGAILSSLVDLTAFYIFERLVFGSGRTGLFFSSVLARLLSGGVNFFYNKKITFRRRGNMLRESGRYLCLFLAVMLVSSQGVALLSWLPVPTVLIKAIIDVVLFVVNYFVERKWVFRKET